VTEVLIIVPIVLSEYYPPPLRGQVPV